MSIVKKTSPGRGTAGIILAAGTASRFGPQKLLADFRGKSVLEWVVEACAGSGLDRVVLVLGHRHHEIQAALKGKNFSSRLETVINVRYREGQSTSLQSGLRRVMGDVSAVMFLLGDQPMLDSATIDFLLDRFYRSEKGICVPCCEGRRRNPTIFSSRYYHRIMQITGDIGARKIIDTNGPDVLRVELVDPSLFHDIDTVEDLLYDPGPG
jgi:molybdenum cofactor cytidylyltransferase